MTKVCKDCRYSVTKSLSFHQWCSRIKKQNLVTGEVEYEVTCDACRSTPYLFDIVTGTCGKRGRWFEPVENKNSSSELEVNS